jgi:hypothetical protein
LQSPYVGGASAVTSFVADANSQLEASPDVQLADGDTTEASGPTVVADEGSNIPDVNLTGPEGTFATGLIGLTGVYASDQNDSVLHDRNLSVGAGPR